MKYKDECFEKYSNYVFKKEYHDMIPNDLAVPNDFFNRITYNMMNNVMALATNKYSVINITARNISTTKI